MLNAPLYYLLCNPTTVITTKIPTIISCCFFFLLKLWFLPSLFFPHSPLWFQLLKGWFLYSRLHTNTHSKAGYQGDDVADDIMLWLCCIVGRALAEFMGSWRGLARTPHCVPSIFACFTSSPLLRLSGRSALACPECLVFSGKKINYSTHSLN